MASLRTWLSRYTLRLPHTHQSRQSTADGESSDGDWPETGDSTRLYYVSVRGPLATAKPHLNRRVTLTTRGKPCVPRSGIPRAWGPRRTPRRTVPDAISARPER